MSGIKQPIIDLITLLKDMPEIKTAGKWNNQIKHLEKGDQQAFALPCAFVEFISYTKLSGIGGDVVAGDITIKIHIGQEFYDAQDGTMDQNLGIYDLKDSIVRKLVNVNLTGCSQLQRSAENENNDNDNVTIYTIEYICEFIDSTGSKYDDGNQRYEYSIPITDIEVDEQTVQNIP
jgi:hypothetical protein